MNTGAYICEHLALFYGRFPFTLVVAIGNFGAGSPLFILAYP